jgi:F420-dependent oxidoreductase-like protein
VDLRIFTEPQLGATYETLLAVARRTEALGFDAFFRSDHYQTFEGLGLPGSTDAWTTLAGLARETSRIRLGTLVSPVTFRLPGPLAITVAQVDAMSGGRVELGLGAGWFDREHSSYGIPFPPFGTRFEMLEEQLAIITGLWRTPVGDTFDFEGSHYQVKESPGLPKPQQAGGPPIVMGGWGAKRTPRLTATYAQEFNVPFGQPADAKQRYEAITAACEKGERDPATVTFSFAVTVCCGSDDRDLARRAKAIGQDLGALRKSGAAGTPPEIVERLSQYADAGATRAYLQVLDLHDLDHLDLIGAEVLPQAASIKPSSTR